jgi:hypothetical protein
MIKTEKGFTLNNSDRQILNHAIKMRVVDDKLIESICNTESLQTWTKRLYDAYMFKIFECPLRENDTSHLVENWVKRNWSKENLNRFGVKI